MDPKDKQTWLLSLMNCSYHFGNTTAYHLGRKKPLSPSTKELDVCDIQTSGPINSLAFNRRDKKS